MSFSIYKERAEQFRDKVFELKQKTSWLSAARLLSFLAFVVLVYECTQIGRAWIICLTVVVFVLFLWFVKWYDKLQQQKKYYTALADINEKEILFLQTNTSPYDTGEDYQSPNHPYSYDLDLFANGGLFAYLNRCSTPFGKEALAESLLQPDAAMINERQAAVKDLTKKLDFRQQLFAQGSLHQSKKTDLQRLLQWIEKDTQLIGKNLYLLLMIFPVVTIGSLLFYFFTENDAGLNWFFRLFTFNLIITFGFAKKITSQLSVSTSVTKILQAFSKQLQLIEKENFSSSLLQSYQQELKHGGKDASQLIHELAALFNYLETIVNLVVSLFLNGLFLFHIHVLYKLGKWKEQHAKEAKGWLELVGKFEALNSFANLAYNNLKFCFPQILTQQGLQATQLGHILVKGEKRVCNDVSFHPQKFAILTGSNMSGKSTFLRTLGTNLVLAKAGSVVCADAFEFYPFNIFVSMRITDSLQEDESFFYAELKRLQFIITQLQSSCEGFVILDEILRGTNSNDKRNGTIGLIRKLAALNTFGIIATHDVVVAELIKEYPQYISNKAFESKIVNDELIFDYKLRDGVCATLSASYLMDKMGII